MAIGKVGAIVFLSKEHEVDMRVIQIIAIVIIVALWIGDIWLVRACDRMERKQQKRRR